eukprot:365586-Chlamydomonas_euryale.AAC.8
MYGLRGCGPKSKPVSNQKEPPPTLSHGKQCDFGLPQSLLLRYHRCSRTSVAHRVAAKRVEMQPRRQRRRNLWRRDDRAERQPVADAFGHRHDVRDDAVVLTKRVCNERLQDVHASLGGGVTAHADCEADQSKPACCVPCPGTGQPRMPETAWVPRVWRTTLTNPITTLTNFPNPLNNEHPWRREPEAAKDRDGSSCLTQTARSNKRCRPPQTPLYRSPTPAAPHALTRHLHA